MIILINLRRESSCDSDVQKNLSPGDILIQKYRNLIIFNIFDKLYQRILNDIKKINSSRG